MIQTTIDKSNGYYRSDIDTRQFSSLTTPEMRQIEPRGSINYFVLVIDVILFEF